MTTLSMSSSTPTGIATGSSSPAIGLTLRGSRPGSPRSRRSQSRRSRSTASDADGVNPGTAHHARMFARPRTSTHIFAGAGHNPPQERLQESGARGHQRASDGQGRPDRNRARAISLRRRRACSRPGRADRRTSKAAAPRPLCRTVRRFLSSKEPAEQPYREQQEEHNQGEGGGRRGKRQKRNQDRAAELGRRNDEVPQASGQNGRARAKDPGQPLRQSGDAAPAITAAVHFSIGGATIMPNRGPTRSSPPRTRPKRRQPARRAGCRRPGRNKPFPIFRTSAAIRSA